jgi:hypothetical protein
MILTTDGLYEFIQACHRDEWPLDEIVRGLEVFCRTHSSSASPEDRQVFERYSHSNFDLLLK